MNACRLCSSPDLRLLLDCGPQPICNRFLKSSDEEEYLHPMLVHQCGACGTIQLVNPVPAVELKPRVDWITYNEPEGHLDDLVDILSRLPGLSGNSIIGGITFKDDTTLARLRRKGFEQTWRLDPKTDLGIDDRGVGVETIQDRLTPGAAERIVEERGLSDLLVVRHIFEHAHDSLRFLKALGELVRPGGHLVFEVPDCTRALDNFDYTTLWEEHVLYFTPATFKQSFGGAGLLPVRYECYPYPFENSLAGVVQRVSAAASSLPDGEISKAELARGDRFTRAFPAQRARLKKFLADYKLRNGPIAIFGAGHLACTFIYLLELAGVIDLVIDDNPHKQGLFMPGSRLPIHGSAALVERGVKLCLLSVNPEAEEKVIRKNQAFVERGGTFASIFPASQHALNLPS